MRPVMVSTNIEKSTIALAGVDSGAKMLRSCAVFMIEYPPISSTRYVSQDSCSRIVRLFSDVLRIGLAAIRTFLCATVFRHAQRSLPATHGRECVLRSVGAYGDRGADAIWPRVCSDRQHD